MKFYPRDPDRFLSGVAGLTLEQIGAYALIIDLLYARDGVLPDDDKAMCSTLHLDPRVWLRVKRELMAAGKIRTTREGMLDANGVASVRLRTEVRSKLAAHAANVRWTNYKNASENNDPVMPASNAIERESIVSKKEGCPVDSVDNVDNSQAEPSEPSEPKQEKPRHPLSSTPALDDAMRRFKERWP
jgi:uncharacterized protein YdaU (DUF1376 family)